MNIKNVLKNTYEYFNPDEKVVKKKKEAFFNTDQTVTSPTGSASAGSMVGIIIFFVFLIFVFSFIYSYGASKLSYSYNIYVGNGTGSAFFWSVVNFFFSGLYYPYYAFFLNPVPKMAVVTTTAITGGMRRRY